MERNSPSVSPHASDAENVPDEEQENDDAELHQVCVIWQDQHETGDE